MNLGQAYEGWQQQTQNRTLYARTKEAFRKAWFTLPTNEPCSYYTREVLGRALAETRVIESFKAQAASVMIHVLNFANWAEPKFNPKPDFTMDDLMEYTKGPLADPNKIKPEEKPSCLDDYEDDNDLDVDPVTAMPRRAMEKEEQKEKPAQESDSRDPLAGVSFEDKPEDETDMEQNDKKPRGRTPRPVAQISPETMEVVKIWPSITDAERETGACNLDRAVSLLRRSADYYWSNPDDAATFKQRLEEKQRQMTERQKEQAERMRKKIKPKAKAEKTAVKPSPAVKVSVTQDPTPPTVTQRQYEQPINDTASITLDGFTDDELMDELDRRGWQGELTRTQIVTIGVK